MFTKNKSKNNAKNVSNNEGTPIESHNSYVPKETQEEPIVIRTPGLDPRFQQQNQTLRCYVMYSDFHQCEYLLGEGNEACTWFKDVFTSICPNAWIERWDEFRAENRMPWFKKADFPKAPYGKKV